MLIDVDVSWDGLEKIRELEELTTRREQDLLIL
jgi:hypothetical protein